MVLVLAFLPDGKLVPDSKLVRNGKILLRFICILPEGQLQIMDSHRQACCNAHYTARYAKAIHHQSSFAHYVV